MAVPTFQDVMLPVLKAFSDGKEHSISEIDDLVAKKMEISQDDLAEKVTSGLGTKWKDRTHWARYYMKRAGLLAIPHRGAWNITDEGQKLLGEKLDRIDTKVLKRFPSFVEFTARIGTAASKQNDEALTPKDSDETPEETIGRAHRALRRTLEDEVLQKLKGCTPSYFEKIVVQLLVAMGYGGSLTDAGKAVGQSGDGGIDGIIKEDKLGLDVVYIQAKRWDSVVDRPEIHKFVGALAGQRASKGVFITTSSFSKGAIEYAAGVQQKVILIDGSQLSELMIDYGKGVVTVEVFEHKKIDNDFFEEE